LASGPAVPDFPPLRQRKELSWPPKMIYSDNGVVKVGADLNRGGSITFLSGTGGTEADNVINHHDMGREVQMSFYAGPSFYNPPTAAYPKGACDKLFGHPGVPWPWNPIGAGDIDGNKGEILNLEHTISEGWNLSMRPLQWACHNVSCECEFNQQADIRFNDIPGSTGVKLVSTLVNHRTDKYIPTAAVSQELPAVYSNGDYYRLVTYNGTSPWTNAPTNEYVTGFRGAGAKGGAWIPGMFVPTEHWAALVNTEGYGLGVVNHDVPHFLAGFSGNKATGSSDTNNAGYIAPVAAVHLPSHVNYTFTSYLVLGNIETIRAFAEQTRPK